MQDEAIDSSMKRQQYSLEIYQIQGKQRFHPSLRKQNDLEVKMTVIHIVLFKLKAELSAAERKEASHPEVEVNAD